MNRECVLPNTCKDIPVTFTSMTIYDVNDSEFPPLNGAYFNTIVTYKVTGHTYLYDSQGIPTLLNDMYLNVDDSLSETSENPVQNRVITLALRQASADLTNQLNALKTSLADEATARARGDADLADQINNTQQTFIEELNTAIANVNAALATGLDGKVDKVEGKGLSTNDFSTAEKEKLAGIEAGAQVNPENISAFANDAGYTTGADVESTVSDAVTDVTNEINLKLDKDLVQSVSVSDTGSTDVVTLTNGLVNLSTGAISNQEVPLPVASSESAGVVNPSIFNSIQDSAEKVDVILNGAVAVPGLSIEPTQEELTTAWETATGREELINGAKIYDQNNNKTWTYYANTTTWYAAGNSGTGTISQFTNATAGIIKGSTNPGQLFAEADGTGSVNNWDETQSRIANLENNPYELPVASTATLGGVKLYEAASGFIYNLSLTQPSDHVTISTSMNYPNGTRAVASQQITGATSTKAGVMTAADKIKLDNLPENPIIAPAAMGTVGQVLTLQDVEGTLTPTWADSTEGVTEAQLEAVRAELQQDIDDNAADISALEADKVEFEVVTEANDPGEGSELAANKIIFVVEE